MKLYMYITTLYWTGLGYNHPTLTTIHTPVGCASPTDANLNHLSLEVFTTNPPNVHVRI